MLRGLSRPTKIALIGLVGAVLIQCLFDPISYVDNVINTNRARIDLPGAVALWDSFGIRDYEVHVKTAAQPACFLDLTVSVRNGFVVDKIAGPDNMILYEPMCPYGDITISRTFDRVRSALTSIDAGRDGLTVTFDATYGFVTRFETRVDFHRGLLIGGAIGECCSVTEFTDFRPISMTP